MKIDLPKEAEIILNVLEDHGFEAFLVGGCIRDSLLGIEPKDWDIVTSALPHETINCFTGFHVVETGLKYGTLTVIINHKPFDVTTYRIDGEYNDNRHPDQVRFVSKLSDDLVRRDFTINALAYNPKTGLQDYFGGLADLQQKIIRCVGEANERFAEDGLRIMRAIRFGASYCFEIESQTAKALNAQKQLLNNIAAERIQKELNLLLCSPGVQVTLREFADVIGVVVPEILPMIGFRQYNPYHHLDVWEHTLESIIHVPPQVMLRWTMLLHDIGKPNSFTKGADGIGHFYGHTKESVAITKQILERLKYSNDIVDGVCTLVLHHDAKIIPQAKHIKRWLHRIGEQAFSLLLEIKKADAKAKHPQHIQEKLQNIELVKIILKEVIDEEQCFSLKDLAINGLDLLQMGIPQGINMGIILNKLLEQVINEEVENEREGLLLLAVQLNK